MSLPKFLVLMSTYNGERYIIEQIDSILRQKNVDVELIIRDDGSTDNTISILKKYAESSKVKLIFGSNIGVVNSFFWLIDNASESEYYALADQDDIWYEDKLARAANVICGSEFNNGKPILYGANQNIVNSNGDFIGVHFVDDMNDKTLLLDVVYRNYMIGCSMVFNKQMIDIFKDKRISRELAYLRFHDTWMVLVARCVGIFIYDCKPVMDYRRHGANLSDGGIDINLKGIKLYLFRLRNFLFPKVKDYRISRTAQFLVSNFDDILDFDMKKVLALLSDYKENMYSKCKLLMMCKDINRTTDNNFIFLMKIIFNRF